MNKIIKNLLKHFKYAALIIIFIIFNISNVFAIDDGIYIVPTTTYFVNPDTNKIDDKGTDKALGEAMARSTIYENALLEVKKGKLYLTIRIKFVSNVSDVKISVQKSKGGGYSTVKSKLISENDVKNYADYRFRIKKPKLNAGVELYFQPLGRNFKFYLSVDEAKAISGNENFVISIKINDKKEQAQKEKADKPADSKNSGSSKQATKDEKENETKEEASAENMTEKEIEDVDRIVKEVTPTAEGQAVFEEDEEQTAEEDAEQEEGEPEQEQEETEVVEEKPKETLEEVPKKAKISTSGSGNKTLKRLKKSSNSSVITLVTFGALLLSFIWSIIYISRK